MRLLGGKQHIICCVASSLFFSTTDTKFQVKHNERWMGTGRRSILDHHILRKYIQKYPGKPLKFGRKIP